MEASDNLDSISLSEINDAFSSEDYFDENFPSLICDICSNGFTDEVEYGQHALNCKANGKKRIFCSICNEEKTVKYFKEHMRLHLDICIYVCDFCQKNFNTKTKLNNHIAKTHLKHLKYQCNNCEESFTTYTDLKNHNTRKHSNSKILECKHPGCLYKTKIKYSLQIHARQHTGEKPFKCIKCNQAFSQKILLQNHQQKHHTPERFDGISVNPGIPVQPPIPINIHTKTHQPTSGQAIINHIPASASIPVTLPVLTNADLNEGFKEKMDSTEAPFNLENAAVDLRQYMQQYNFDEIIDSTDDYSVSRIIDMSDY